jgi:hypothetical protein
MTESYSFYYLNKEGALVTIVDMRCADDQVAMFRVSQFRPPSCASIEIWSGDRCVLKADDAKASQTMQRTKEHHPGH